MARGLLNDNDRECVVAESKMLNLYRYNKITGYWIVERQVTAHTSKDWLDLYALDSPHDWFYV